MGNNDAVSIQVGPDIIKPIVEAKIQAALVDAFGGNEVLVANAVKAILYAKVDSEGKFTSSSYGTKSLIEWTCEHLIKSAAELAIKEYLSTQKDRLVGEFQKQFKNKSKLVAEKMVAGIIDYAKAQWDFRLNVNYKEEK